MPWSWRAVSRLTTPSAKVEAAAKPATRESPFVPSHSSGSAWPKAVCAAAISTLAKSLTSLKRSTAGAERRLLQRGLLAGSLPLVMQDRPERVLAGGGGPGWLPGDEDGRLVTREVVQ